jgi:hypothetical protein
MARPFGDRSQDTPEHRNAYGALTLRPGITWFVDPPATAYAIVTES